VNLSENIVNELMPFIDDNLLIMPYYQKISFGMRHENEIMRVAKAIKVDWNELLVKNNATLGNAHFAEMCDFAADFIIRNLAVAE
jgi:hypothetical protein